MKTLKTISITILCCVLFFSCDTENAELIESPNSALLETYTLNKDGFGAYSLELKINNADVNEVYDEETNKKEFFFTPSEKTVLDKFTKDVFVGEKLQLSFEDSNTNKTGFITVYDDDIKFLSKGSTDTNKLKSYSIKQNKDETFELEFKVNNNVEVSFAYNSDNETYEVHLKEGDSDVAKFKRDLEKEDGKPLKIDFVNYNYASKSSTVETRRKPRIIIND
ncbi:hypothetical protein [uncultured Polaribacter sp.]|uniref:hypothetical protein n=1 Tax=uncultured Polaribacter sp. TaxID=174711 RepID=UPI00260FC8E5|nr:hypothetical protein [uncultured Polaribacter sp.]